MGHRMTCPSYINTVCPLQLHCPCVAVSWYTVMSTLEFCIDAIQHPCHTTHQNPSEPINFLKKTTFSIEKPVMKSFFPCLILKFSLSRIVFFSNKIPLNQKDVCDFALTNFACEQCSFQNGDLKSAETSNYFSPQGTITVRLLYCPLMLSHFLHLLGNYTRRAIFPEMCKINQSNVDFHRKPLCSLWLDWFIEFVLPDLFLRGRG